MRCPTLKELPPPPPPGKIGWPWTEESPQLPDTMPDGQPWPKISIVTPNYNYGRFLEETIRSVLLQGYPNLEYIIIDGGSTDDSVEIIKKYEPWLAYWVSEKDQGQSNAINNGLRLCTGDIFNWLNSDDLLEPGSLRLIGTLIENHDILIGACVNFDYDGETQEILADRLTLRSLIRGTDDYHQPAIWLSLPMVRECGYLNETMYFYFDWEFYVRLLAGGVRIRYTPNRLARFRLHCSSKTCTGRDGHWRERIDILFKLLSSTQTEVAREADFTLRQMIWVGRIRGLEKAYHKKLQYVSILRSLLLALGDPLVRLRIHGGLLGFLRRNLLRGMRTRR